MANEIAFVFLPLGGGKERQNIVWLSLFDSASRGGLTQVAGSMDDVSAAIRSSFGSLHNRTSFCALVLFVTQQMEKSKQQPSCAK